MIERSRWQDDQAGLGLVEMMVAIMIIGLVFTAMAGSLTTSLRSIHRDQTRVQATAVGNELLEELQGLPFRLAAFYSDEATDEFGSLTHDGEAIAVIPPESPRDPRVPSPGPRDLTRDGRSFVAETMITWVDDPADGEGSADADDTTDYKRFVVDLTWQERGRTRTATVEALRAPTASEQPLGTGIDPDIVPISDRPDGKISQDFTVLAEAEEPQQTVEVSFLEREASTPTGLFLNDGGGGLSWSLAITSGNYRFANGETLFTFTATTPDGETTTVVDRALFLHTLAIRPEEVRIDGVDVTAAPVIEVTSSGGCAFDLTASVTGALASDSVTASWSAGPAGPTAMLSAGTTVFGADFALAHPDGADFPIPANVGDTTTTDLTIDVARSADGASLAFTATGVVVERVSSCS